ncbi:MAG: prolipoprotein diacylglyceryl transferase [Pseudomonadota bacterium]|nr:prolipoprotein diacylglyceryl transferase [Pseudomonadota bacterium]
MLPVIAFPAIDPIALQVGPLAIRWYALAYIAGILLGWRYASWLAGRRGGAIPPQAFDDFVMWATLGIILGGRLGYVFFYKPFYFLANPAEIIMVWQGGMAFHGGLLGVVAATWWFTRRRGLNFLSLADLVCAAAPIGLFFGRIANFINGELWGRPSEVAWAMVFPHAGQLPRHPSQLYEAALEGLLLFAALAALARRDAILARPGLLSGVFFLGYGLTRSAAEFFREPDAHLGFLMGGATMGQILSIPMILLGVALIRHAQRPSTTHG